MPKRKWRILEHSERMRYAQAMRRLNLGIWGYPLSTLRAIHLTTREGNDNTTAVFAKDLRKLVMMFRKQGYDFEYDGTLGFTPEKGLLHFHGIVRIKGGYFLCPVKQTERRGRRILGDSWNICHGAFVVMVKPVNTGKELAEYIVKHVLSEYIEAEEGIRNRFLFSRGWMRKGWKEVEEIAKLWTLGGLESDGGLDTIYMNKEKWSKVNEIEKTWAEKRQVTFFGDILNGKPIGYFSLELGRIREVYGSAFPIMIDGKVRLSTYQYLDY